MPPCPGARQALELLHERPHIPFGVHLTLVCDFAGYRWQTLAPAEKVPSLLYGDGCFFTTDAKGQLLARAQLLEVELELRSQIEAVSATGLTPTHLDWHSLADGGREDIFDLGLALAEEYRLAARVWLEPSRRTARQLGLPVVDHDFLDSFSLEVDTKASRYLQLLHEILRASTSSAHMVPSECALSLSKGADPAASRTERMARLGRSTKVRGFVTPILSS